MLENIQAFINSHRLKIRQPGTVSPEVQIKYLGGGGGCQEKLGSFSSDRPTLQNFSKQIKKIKHEYKLLLRACQVTLCIGKVLNSLFF